MAKTNAEKARTVYEDGPGLTTITQYGVEWPDGTITWGDPQQDNLVRLREVIKSDRGSGYNTQQDFYLHPGTTPGHHHSMAFGELVLRYGATLEAAHLDANELPMPELVQRTVTVVRAEPQAVQL